MAKKTPVHHTPPDSYIAMWSKINVMATTTFEERMLIADTARQVTRDRRLGKIGDDSVYELPLDDGRKVLVYSIDRLEIE